ncbi:DUF2188 domain-containing protein [Paraburkholderia caballeronis]|uniref:DUF2188 domain-containing protein n=2 Tax=Paraburkholderia caballeronis TaxID=416943 RepID=UPI002814AD75|nr:DUF2188 domain-containing protein [Paraburkholderia caballeronis]
MASPLRFTSICSSFKEGLRNLPLQIFLRVLVMSTKKDSNNLYVERRPQGDYAVRKPDSDRASAVAPTQGQAIDRAKQLNPDAAIHIERVRNTNGGHPDKWRKG